MSRQGQLYVVSAPSGAGKTSLVTALIESMPNVVESISHTTRAMREGEVDGTHYHFVDKVVFESLLDSGAFLESAQVFDNYYGTSEAAVDKELSAGHDVVLVIDWQGAQQIRARRPHCLSVFIAPPSKAELEKRLIGRGQDSDAVIERRMREAESEMSHYGEFNYLIVNDDFDQALNEIRSIFIGNRQRLEKQQQAHVGLLEELLTT